MIFLLFQMDPSCKTSFYSWSNFLCFLFFYPESHHPTLHACTLTLCSLQTKSQTRQTLFTMITTGCTSSWTSPVSGPQGAVFPSHSSTFDVLHLQRDVFLFFPAVCDPNPCFNGGSCQNSSDTEYQCNCSEPYIGIKCQRGRNFPACLHEIMCVW